MYASNKKHLHSTLPGGARAKLEPIRPPKKTIEVNASSLVDLKIELARKQREYKEQLLDPELRRRNKQHTKGPAFLKDFTETNKGVFKRDRLDRESCQEEAKDLEKSRRSLEAKAALYERIKRGQLQTDEEASQFLVDFEQKHWEEKADQPSDRKKLPENPEHQLNNSSDLVSYVDAFGRDRTCPRHELSEHLKEELAIQKGHFDRGASDGSTSSDRPDLLSADMRRELDRQQWEQEALERLREQTPAGPVHFRDINPGEIRQLGTGYFKFSADEEERLKQMEDLKKSRSETLSAHKRRDALKKRRADALEARLNKIRKRKGQPALATPNASVPTVVSEPHAVVGSSNDAATGALSALPASTETDPLEESIDDLLSFYKTRSQIESVKSKSQHH
eukprot:m.338609 g.338609  ORF g.338609 m.338609 type:complete len:394 (-) comp20562_c0_seq3:469-1650(-)